MIISPFCICHLIILAELGAWGLLCNLHLTHGISDCNQGIYLPADRHTEGALGWVDGHPSIPAKGIQVMNTQPRGTLFVNALLHNISSDLSAFLPQTSLSPQCEDNSGISQGIVTFCQTITEAFVFSSSQNTKRNSLWNIFRLNFFFNVNFQECCQSTFSRWFAI